MPYRFKAGETVPENIQRIVLEELESGADVLTNSNNRDEAIHEARKSVKKIRGALRLMRPELGETYATETKHFRGIGHQLSDIRDAAAVLEIFDGVVGKYTATLNRRAILAIRRTLEDEKKQKEQGTEAAKVVRGAIGLFRSAAKRVEEWPLKRDGFAAISPGLKLTYQTGRKALKLVSKDPSDTNFHYFRRRAKDHWYHIRLLESLWTEVMQAHEASLKDLEQWLGDDHNLVVLREKLEEASDRYGGSETVKAFLSITGRHQAELREQALSLGQRVYQQKPKLFTTAMEELWDIWQDQPDSMKDSQKQQRDGGKKQARPPQRKRAASAA
ncbi:MAG: CHAD domain-containing protein [Acidobacteriaceae bacterium]|nr:CHAD domain-containing protein [Acidobacteriaceae bacterium]